MCRPFYLPREVGVQQDGFSQNSAGFVVLIPAGDLLRRRRVFGEEGGQADGEVLASVGLGPYQDVGGSVMEGQPEGAWIEPDGFEVPFRAATDGIAPLNVSLEPELIGEAGGAGGGVAEEVGWGDGGRSSMIWATRAR